MCSTNNPRNFSDDMIQAISSDGKSNRRHSHGSNCRHHHHNHSHINEKDEIKSQSEDIFRHLKSFWIGIPFACLFLFKEAAIHSVGLWVLISLCVTSFYLNSRLKGATLGFEPPIYAFLMSIFICGIVCLLFYLLSFRKNEIYFGLLCMPNKIPSDDWISLLWAVIIVDFSLKIFTIFVKSFVVFLTSHRFLLISTRSVILIWIEFISQVYRHLPPAVTWVRHIIGNSTTSLSFRIFFCLVYILLKAIAIGTVVASMWPIFKPRTFSLPYQTNFISSKEDKELCPLCFEKRGPKLAILRCNHTFCRDCMDRWLIQGSECPLCSLFLGEEFTTWRDGSTSCLVYFF
ncbi:unnamed protein product [Hymenolepis diminuta]|uniref:RING-type domain-containing protein n=1 Tax=Hymenolepis diminuta TaxID=6216 RepID=A0A564XX96_HYMDI|nr:unnamed protein product [Hymenolepis diminuta]